MRRLVALSVLVVVLAGAALLLREEIGSLVVRRTVTSGSAAMLESVEQVGELETLAVVSRTVFPHEFYIDGVSYTSLLRRVTRGEGDAEEVLSSAEQAHFAAANLAAELGLATVPGAGGFVVVTSVDRYGYRMGELSEQLRSALAAQPAERPAESGLPQAELPTAQRLSFEIEDLNRASYPFGEVPLDARDWNEVSSFVREWVIRRHEAATYRSAATQTGVELIQALIGGPEAPLRLVPASQTPEF